MASSQVVTIDHHAPVSITLSSFSPRGFPSNYAVLTKPKHGALSALLQPCFISRMLATPARDAFTFKVNDGTAVSNTATVNIKWATEPSFNGFMKVLWPYGALQLMGRYQRRILLDADKTRESLESDKQTVCTSSKVKNSENYPRI